MKKLLFIIIISILYVSCSSNAPSETKSTDSASAKRSEDALPMPYKAAYSSDISIGKKANALTVLNFYKAWQDADMTAFANALSDSVSFFFADGSAFIGTKDSFMVVSKQFRDSISSIKLDFDVWMPVHSNDHNEDAVLVWYKETDRFKNGKSDSAIYSDINGLKDGKINFVQSHMKKIHH